MTDLSTTPGRELRNVLTLAGVRYDVAGLTLLNGVGLQVAAGEAVALLGSSGSGKSTLLAVITGLIRPASGTVTVAGRDMTVRSQRRLSRYRRDHIGVVFQSGEILEELSAVENVELPALWAGRPPRQARERAEELLSRVGLSDRRTTSAGALSGGERQRVAVARAMVNEPKLVVADEPTGSLDEEMRDSVAELLFSLPASTGCGLVVVTHDRTVAACADRSLRLADGKLTEAVARR